MDLRQLFRYIPEVRKPEEKKVSFNTKLTWTLITLGAFFVLSNVTLYGLSANALERFEFLATVLAADFGSLITLGIGPIVMASIILQLLTGAGIITIDTNTSEGKRFFQGVQKLLVFFFIFFEALIYVLMGGLQADPLLGGMGPTILIIQLILGGIAIFYMDEVTSKWGFGSGVSLFIAAGVSRQLFTAAFQFIDQQGRMCLLDFTNVACPGRVFSMLQAIVTRAPLAEVLVPLSALIATALIFLLVVWAQALKVEIPLSFGRIRGYSMKWPLAFFYASVIPVILTAALAANVQLFGGIIENAALPCLQPELGGICSGGARFASYFSWMGQFQNGVAVSGLAFWLGSTNIVESVLRGSLLPIYLLQAITHILFFTFFSALFSVFWVKTSGLDAKGQAQRIASSGLQVAGFRQDIRILESILNRYVMPLTIMGGIAIGLLASVTNMVGAIVSGTSFLLVIMITFQIYQSIAQQHMNDMNPALSKFMGGA